MKFIQGCLDEIIIFFNGNVFMKILRWIQGWTSGSTSVLKKLILGHLAENSLYKFEVFQGLEEFSGRFSAQNI